MQCTRCGHNNISSFRFCEACLAPLTASGSPDDVVGAFFADADLLEAGATDVSRGAAQPTRFHLPWRPDAERLAMGGREAQLAAATDLLLTPLQARRFSAVAIHGEQGSGRSRLLVALREKIQAALPAEKGNQGVRFLVTTGQGTHRPMSLLERLLRLRFDIPDYLGGTIAGERFERSVEAFYGDSAGAEVARTCGPMLGFHFWNEHDIDFMDRAEQARRAREATSDLLLRDLADPPTVIVVDDAGEADAETLEFFAELLADAPELPAVLVLATDRRGANRRPWLADLPSVDLAPLGEDVLAGLARKALDGVQGVDDTAIQTLVRHANGRPGTLLDEIETLAKHGAITLDKSGWTLHPGKLDELVARGDLHSQRGGRFDGLSDEQLKIVSIGAVFGTRFWLGGAVALLRKDEHGARSVGELGRDGLPEKVQAACQVLIDRGLLLPERAGLLPSETCYRFVEESDRDSLLELHDTATLQTLSNRAAVWLQMVAGERSAELADVLAPLWLKAGDSIHAAHVYLRAGQRALDEYRHADARTYLEQARKLVPSDFAHVHTDAVLGLGQIAEADGKWSEAETFYRDALELAWQYRARSRGALALQRLGRMLRNQGKVQQALENLVPALRLYEAAGDLRGLASICDDVGRAYWTTGHAEPAMQFLGRALQYRERLGDRLGQAYTLANLGVVSLSRGQLDKARGWLEKAVEIQRERKNLGGLVEALNGLGAVQVAAGDNEAAVDTMQEAHALSKRVGNRRWQALLQNNLGEVLLLVSRLDEGEALLYKAVEGAGRLGDHVLLSDAARNLAVAARRRNDHERALKWARRSVAAAGTSDVVRTRAASLRTLGEVLADGNDFDGAEDAFKKAEDVLDAAGELYELQACLQVHAAFLVRVGRGAAADALLARVDRLVAGSPASA